MSKKVSFGKDAMDKMLLGFDTAARAVIGTIGPKGRNVYFEDAYTPKITNDGATIASKIGLADREEDAGAYVIRNITSQQNDDVGDGTTTVAVLTHSLVHESLKRPENPMEIRESLKAAGERVLKVLSKTSKKVENVEQVALISAEDPTLAKMITEIIGKLGDKAAISVEDSKTFGTEYEIVEGYEADTGFLSQYFANDGKEGKLGTKAIFEDVPVLVSHKKISNIIDIQPLWDKLAASKITTCAIFCEDIDDGMLGVFVKSKLVGAFQAVVIRASGDGLQDIEAVTGATAVSDANGVSFQSLGLEHLGKAKKLISDKHKTLIVGAGATAKIRAQELDDQAEEEPNQYMKELIKGRASKLRGGVAVLKVGASTDLEREYLKLKAEDAIKAVQAALAEGVVEGGGLALWRIAEELVPKTIGEEILKKSLKAPFKAILENAGKDYAEVVMHMEKGYNVKNDEYVDMFEAGILDPVKVERCALENAISTAGQFITTFATITEIPDAKV